MRVHDSQAYRKMDVTRERISRILELREILLSIQTGFSLVNAAVVCAILESISGLEPSSVITEPRCLKLVTALEDSAGDHSHEVEQRGGHMLWDIVTDNSQASDQRKKFCNTKTNRLFLYSSIAHVDRPGTI